VVQTGGIIRCIARSWDLYGDSDAEANAIDQLLEGIKDFGDKCPGWPAPGAKAELPKTLEALKVGGRRRRFHCSPPPCLFCMENRE
jgi:hypothetical protein